MLLPGQDGACARDRYERELRSSRLRPASAACHGLAGHLAGACVAEVGLLRSAPRIGEVDPHHRTLRLLHFFAAVVADQPRNTCHGFPPGFADLSAPAYRKRA